MPPRPPPTPGWLTILLSITAAAALWIATLVDQGVRGLVGRTFGVSFDGIELSAAHAFLPAAIQGPTASLGAGAFTCMVLAGALVSALVAWGFYTFVRAMHSAGWMRALALEWVMVAMLWLPAAMAAAALPVGRGPGHELYARLGPPMAGTWTAVALGLVALFLAAGAIAACAVAIGRAWMRADGLEFRRRLVRVTAGWPAVTALALMAYAAGWGPSLWSLLFVFAALGALQVQTR